MTFRIPTDESSTRYLGSAIWLTNLPVTPKPLVLTKYYSPEVYPRYDNQTVIHVDKVSNIPQDYLGGYGRSYYLLKVP